MPTELEQIKNMLSVHMEVSQRRHDESQKALRDLSVAVIGDEKLGVDGMVKRVDKLEKSEQARKKRDMIILGAASATGATSGTFFAWIAGLFK